MDFSLPSEVEEFREELRGFLAANLHQHIIDAGRRHGADRTAFDEIRAWNRKLADAGWSAISWPREYGGRGASALEQLVYAEETIRAGAPLPVNVIGMNNIAPAIMEYGTEFQKRTLLPRMRRADDIWCQGMSEPNAGSDLAALQMSAIRDRDEFIVSGQKVWTSLGHRADWCQLYVRTDPDAPKHRGISCLLVDLDRPGIQARPLITLNGNADFAEIFFDEVRVPTDALLGPLNEGWRVATTTLGHERAGAARLYVELQTWLADLVADLGRTGPDDERLLDDPAVLRRLGELSVRISYLRVLCLRSISAGLHGAETSDTASLAKTIWGEAGQDLAALAFDTLGPLGAGGRWAELRLTSRSLTIAGGTTQVNKNIIATRALGLPRR